MRIIARARHASMADRDVVDHEKGVVERQAFLLACVWDDKGLADRPTISQVTRFMHCAEMEGQWTPERSCSPRGVFELTFDDDQDTIRDLLHHTLQSKRPRSMMTRTSRCVSCEDAYAASDAHGDVHEDMRCLCPVLGEARAPLGMHFCAKHICVRETPEDG
jgi:hypothetical protein